ncbi:VRR-NUC domain-containing protein [Photobacterium profundum]|uniref:VRR-NUC domain-containing protein n=1 Tax=Photobacterium profundum (strain SS9) TaxID=298386 RepID=Q6LHC6_PHOPR|nr:VRR-NUC domain-containing protein [Photobacterium profundum]CAG23304.1 hypothetical protein PBPRB1438 [Photobacterium profundum SS9]
MTESQILTDIIRAAFSHPCVGVLLRNNVGAVKSGSRWIRYGLGKGSSDLIGWTTNGIFLAVEVKTLNGKVSPEQIKFIEDVRKHGGIAFIATSRDEFDRLMTEHINFYALKRERQKENPF